MTSLDFDNDGYNELFGGDYEGNVVFAFRNKTEGTIWDTDVSITIPQGEFALFGKDYRGTDEADLLTGSYDNSQYKLYTGYENIISSNPQYQMVLNHYRVDFAGDINGDGYEDLIGTENDDPTVVIYWGGPNIDPNNNYSFTAVSGNDVSLRDHGDFNNDGFTDIIIDYFDGSAIYPTIFFGSQNGIVNFSSWELEPTTKMMFLDFNGDGYDDIFARTVDRKKAVLYLGNPSGEVYYSDLPGINFRGNESIEKSGDFNGDGYDDFIVSDLNRSDTNTIYWGGNDLANIRTTIFIQEYSSYSVADINGDNIEDVVYRNGTVFLGGSDFPNNHDMRFGNFIVVNSIADINGDGLNDLFVLDWGNIENHYNIILGSTINSSPRIVSVKDVPADQGGFVTLSWFKSGLDGGKVKNYQIERSIAPVGSGYAWEVINTIPASHFNYYSYTAPTLNDETPDNTGNTYFRVTALTENEDVYYRSNIMYGHSTDNLAPLAPSGLKAVAANNGVKVSWQLNSEEDLKEYNIYRSVSEEVSFDTLDAYAVVNDSLFVDESPLAESYYYFVRAVDIHENIGNSSSVLYNLTVVEEETNLPTEYNLSQNYPNPFNPTTTIKYSISKTQHVKLTVFNALGEVVKTLVNKEQTAGYYSVQFDASKLTSGIYFYRLQAGGFVSIKKMVLLR
jgi:hypothetical protein